MPRKTIVIELSERSLAALEVAKGRSSPEIMRWARRELPETGITSTWIRAFWQDEKFSSFQAILLLPDAMIRYKTLTFPVLPEAQLESAVKMELENGSDADEIHRCVGMQNQGEGILAKTVTVSDRQLEEIIALFSGAGVEIYGSGLSSEALRNFIFTHSSFFETDTPRFAYLHLKERESEFGVATETDVAFRRDFPLGGADLEDKTTNEIDADFLEEVRLSLIASQAQGQSRPDKLWLFGDVSQALEKLKTRLQTEGMEILIPTKLHLGGVDVSSQLPCLAPLIGLALDQLDWNCRKSVRIYTHRQTKRKIAMAQSVKVLQYCLVALLVCLSVYFTLQTGALRSRKTDQWLTGLQPRLNTLRHMKASTVTIQKMTDRMERIQGQRGRELEFLLALEQSLPEDTRITDFTMEEGKVKDLAGSTPSVAFLLRKLREDPRLRSLRLKGSISLGTDGKEMFQMDEKKSEKEF